MLLNDMLHCNVIINSIQITNESPAIIINISKVIIESMEFILPLVFKLSKLSS